MAATFITPEDYPAIRAALGVDIDEVVLPDSIIELKTNLDAAEDEIKRRDPLWAGRGDADKSRLVTAAIYLCASRIAPSIPDITQEQTGQYESYQRKAVDWPKRSIDLREDADSLINFVISGGTRAGTRPAFFDVASGRRGRRDLI